MTVGPTPGMHEDLIETLRLAQRLGFFGPGAIEPSAAHAQQFAVALGALPAGTRIVDLGSGGGLPGLVMAAAYPECQITLTDRRTARTDFLERAVARLGYRHVTVQAGDVGQLIASGATFDVATARGFGPPEVTLATGAGLVRSGGLIAISEPPEGDRWPAELLARCGVQKVTNGPVAVFERFT